jgi:hypothetical protein
MNGFGAGHKHTHAGLNVCKMLKLSARQSYDYIKSEKWRKRDLFPAGENGFTLKKAESEVHQQHIKQGDGNGHDEDNLLVN